MGKIEGDNSKVLVENMYGIEIRERSVASGWIIEYWKQTSPKGAEPIQVVFVPLCKESE